MSSGRSSGRNSVPGHTHTPSSASGSLSRYSSLTTPFYQPQPGTRQREPKDMAATPVNKTQSRTNYYGSSGSIPGQMGPSPPGLLPFRQLIPPAYSPASNLSSYRNRTSSGTGSPLSPPPSSSPGTHILHHTGTKGELAQRNSGTKLSALTEERGRKNRTIKKSSGNPTEKTTSGGFDIITQSCLLGFSDSEDNHLDLEEANFPLSLTASINSSLSADQEDTDREGVEPKGEESQGLQSSGNTLQFVGNDAVHFAPVCSRPRSSTGTRKEQPDTRPSGISKKRASSFSYQRNPRLSQQLAALNTKASSLSAHSDPKFQTPPSSEIIPINAPFLFSAGASGSHMPPLSVGGEPQGGRALPPASAEEGSEEVRFGSLSLSDMIDSLVVVREMYAMAKARQGPILLLSTSADLVRTNTVELGCYTGPLPM